LAEAFPKGYAQGALECSMGVYYIFRVLLCVDACFQY
jgi:hypothetical protein